MMRRRHRVFRCAVAISALVTLTAAVRPVEAEPTRAPLAAVTPQALELGRRLGVAMGVRRGLEALFDQNLQRALAGFAEEAKAYPSDRRREILDAYMTATEAPRAWLLGAVTDDMARVYAQTLPAEDLARLVSFYESPIGQQVITNNVVFSDSEIVKQTPGLDEATVAQLLTATARTGEIVDAGLSGRMESFNDRVMARFCPKFWAMGLVSEACPPPRKPRPRE
jgi:hypothetical protein